MLQIKNIELKNYRCFQDYSVTFHPQLTVLTSPNGQGKSTVLDAIGLSLTPLLQSFDQVFGNHIELDDVFTKNDAQRFPCSVKIEGTLLGQPAEWLRELRTAKGKTTNKDAAELKVVKDYINEATVKDGVPDTPSLSALWD